MSFAIHTQGILGAQGARDTHHNFQMAFENGWIVSLAWGGMAQGNGGTVEVGVFTDPDVNLIWDFANNTVTHSRHDGTGNVRSTVGWQTAEEVADIIAYVRELPAYCCWCKWAEDECAAAKSGSMDDCALSK